MYYTKSYLSMRDYAARGGVGERGEDEEERRVSMTIPSEVEC